MFTVAAVNPIMLLQESVHTAKEAAVCFYLALKIIKYYPERERRVEAASFCCGNFIRGEQHSLKRNEEQRAEWMHVQIAKVRVLMQKSSSVACLAIICERNEAPINLIGRRPRE